MLAAQWRGQTLPGAAAVLRVPSLARLAREGMVFERAYCALPEAAPSRASLLTGKYPHACGVTANGQRLPESEPSLAGELLRAGYETGYIGLWALDGGGDPGYVPPGARRHGFDYWAAFNRGHRYHAPVYFRDDPEPVKAQGFEPDVQTALAIDFIRRERTAPFFLVVSWGPPHPPRVPPPAFAAMYRDAQFTLRHNVPAELAEMARTAWADYYAMCSAIDACAGKLIDALGESGLLDGTVVAFTSDHGDMLYSHGLHGGGEPYEESIRVPLIIRYPRAIADTPARTLPVVNVDLAPALLSWAGVAAPPGMQGISLAGQLTGSGERRESLFCQGRLGTPREWRLVVRGFDKLVADRDHQVTHLFNLQQDPYELENLAAAPSHRTRRDEMRALLEYWMRRTGDQILPSGLKLRD